MLPTAAWSHEPIADVGAAMDLAVSPSDAAALDYARWRRIERDVVALARLEDDWDGDGAEAPRQSIVDSAARLLRHLRDSQITAPSRAAASRDGSVIIEWQRPGGYYLEAEISEPSSIEWMERRLAGQPARHWTEQWPPAMSWREDACQIESDIWDDYLVPAY